MNLKAQKNYDPCLDYYERTEFQKWAYDVVQSGLKVSELHLIQKYFTKKDRVLDLGCGGGREALYLSRLGFQVTGIDISQKLIEVFDNRIRNEGIKNITTHVMDARNLSAFPDNTFNYALLLEKLLVQIPKRADRLKVLKEVKKVIVPGGIVILSTNSRKEHLNKICQGE